jgi:hypothetical protein
MDELPPTIPLGATGRLEAQPLVNASGDHALLVREGEASRALITGERGGDRDRVIVVPLDDDVQLRVDGDALAVWLARGSVTSKVAAAPAWASLLGLLLVIAFVVFAVVGSVTTFSWLVDLLS